MNDLISRQDAIDELDKFIQWCDKALRSPLITSVDAYATKVERASLKHYREVLELLEPAQPSEIQDILDYLDTTLHPIISPEHWNVYSELHDMISMLQPAQPEPAIPISWLMEEIERLEKHDGFAKLDAVHLRVLIKRWENEQNDTE